MREVFLAILRKYLIVALSTLLLLTVPIRNVGAVAGDLDISFGRGGIVTTNVAQDDGALAVAVQPDGKIVAVGYSSPFYEQFTLVRYDRSGNLDASFGDGGKVITDFGGSGSAHAVVIQGDGKIVAGGIASTRETGLSFALARYDRNGALDPSFGSGGKVISVAGLAIGALILQRDGRIVAGGQGGNDFTLARFNSDGSPDAGFSRSCLLLLHPVHLGKSEKHHKTRSWHGIVVRYVFS